MLTSVSLLPQSPQGLLLSPSDRLRVLALKKALVDQAISALQDFLIYQRAHAFDGHIGDTSCQIRAYQVYLLISTQRNETSIQYQLEELRHLSARIADAIVDYQASNHKKERYQSIIDFLRERNISCNLSELTIYLTQLHVLSSFKAHHNNGDLIIEYKKMCKALNISKHTARKIVHIYQVNVSKLSCDFIHSLILRNFNVFPDYFIDNLRKIDEDGRHSLPCYLIFCALYEAMLKQKCPILITCKRYFKNKHVDTISLVFKVSDNKKNYVYCPLNNVKENDLYFVIHGDSYFDDAKLHLEKSNYIKYFIKQGIKNILFSNMAVHPQYSGKKLMPYKDEPFLKTNEEKIGVEMGKINLTLLTDLHIEQQKMRAYANKFGFGKFDQAFFYIRHIFCDTLVNQAQVVVTTPHKGTVLNQGLLPVIGTYATA